MSLDRQPLTDIDGLDVVLALIGDLDRAERKLEYAREFARKHNAAELLAFLNEEEAA